MLAAQVARVKGAARVVGCDVSAFPVDLASKVGLTEMIQADSSGFKKYIRDTQSRGLDVIIDTVGTPESIQDGLSILNKAGAFVLLAVHEDPLALPSVLLSGERSLLTSSNSRYRHFPEAIDLLAEGKIQVEPLITHRFHLPDALEAFAVMRGKEQHQAYKVVIVL
jgi:threonine dehydrogenase-like Zn-dependent dehydrogenase